MSVQEQRKPKTVTILVNNKPVELPDRHTTGAEIKREAGVPLEFKLYGPHGNEIADDQRLTVHPREKFTAISGVDVS
jgi:hypothetical protein